MRKMKTLLFVFDVEFGQQMENAVKELVEADAAIGTKSVYLNGFLIEPNLLRRLDKAFCSYEELHIGPNGFGSSAPGFDKAWRTFSKSEKSSIVYCLILLVAQKRLTLCRPIAVHDDLAEHVAGNEEMEAA